MAVNNWKVYVQENFGQMSVRVYLINKDRIPSIAHIKNGRVELEEMIEGSEPSEPTLELPLDAWEGLKAAMVENHERDKNTVEAELGATKYHLEDMRKIVFNKTK